MDTQAASYLLKETRINFDSALPNSTIILDLPTPESPFRRRRTNTATTTEVATPEDEKTFKERHLASAAGVYHRKYHSSPKSFAWRILENGKTLSIAAIDLCKQENKPESPLTLRLNFPSPIRDGCIALTDPEEHDILTVYALTETNKLFTLTLRCPDFFQKKAATEDNANDWCKVYESSAFGFKYPHRLVSPLPSEVLITTHDGGMIRLARRPGEDASVWQEIHYGEGGWRSGLKSFVPWHGSNTVRYEKVNMELPAITSIVAKEIRGGLCAYTVSLDHKLRIWNLHDGKVFYNGDLLGMERKAEELGKWVINPSHSNLVRVIHDPSDIRTVIVTYSPHRLGEFKFWATHWFPDGTAEVTDMFPDMELKPPPPSSDIWTMADFDVSIQSDEAGKVSLWILWKNNITYRVQSVDLRLLSAVSTQNSWNLDWVSVAGETLSDSPIPALTSKDPEGPTEKWLNYILFPGRYTTATLETALAIYEKSVGGAKKGSIHSSKSLPERICSVISSTASLSPLADDQLDFAAFKAATDAQWRRFYRLIIELNKQRGEALSLNIEPEQQSPVIAVADGISVVRDCSQLERLWHNPDNYGGKEGQVSRLISTAAAFRENFSNALQHACEAQLKADLSEEPSLIDVERLQLFHDKCDFLKQVTDEDYEQLVANFGGSLKGFTLKLFESLLSTMSVSEDLDSRLERQPLATFGRKVIVKGVQEVVELHRSICLDQLALLAFIEGEVEPADISNLLDTGAVYSMLMTMLKRLELLDWLAKTEISIQPLKSERSVADSFLSNASIDSTLFKRIGETKTVTVLEGTLSHLLGLVTDTGTPIPSLLTDLLLRVCDPNSEIELQPALIQAFLIKTGRPDLAVSFSRFCSQDPFSTYIRGRAYLATKDYETAAIHFKKAAFGLSRSQAHDFDRHSASLLDDTEWNLLHSGLPSYYAHIISLYDAQKAHSHVIDFVRLALQFAAPTTASSATTKPIHAQKSSKNIELLRTDLLSRMFSAALHTARYDVANSTLHLITDHALKQSYLSQLITALCEHGAVSTLLALPWLGSESAVDAVLAQKCAGIADVNTGTPYHSILYSFRIRRGDFRGAATIAYERVQKLRAVGGSSKAVVLHSEDEEMGGDELDTDVTRGYLGVINALCCVEPDQAWIFAEPVAAPAAVQGKKSVLGASLNGANGVAKAGKRRVLKLADLRRELGEEMDRVEDLRRGRFAFGDAEDVDMDA